MHFNSMGEDEGLISGKSRFTGGKLSFWFVYNGYGDSNVMVTDVIEEGKRGGFT